MTGDGQVGGDHRDGPRFPPRLVVATKNPGKIREIVRICAAWPAAFVTAADVDHGAPAEGLAWPDVEETGATYLENALLKARAVASATGLPSLADDSGIEVDALHGGPGPRSARFAREGASDAENLALMIERLRPVPAPGRTGRYRCVAACAFPDGRVAWAEATCEIRLTTEPRGGGGFGYDPIAVPVEVGGDRTMAELAPEEKDRVSHRGRAFRALGERLADPETEPDG